MTTGMPGGPDTQPQAVQARERITITGRVKRFLFDKRSLFLIVGVLNTVFATLLFIGLVLLFGPRVPSVVSLVIAWLASLLTCFHFGMHHEHHLSPNTPWWRLPEARREALRLASTAAHAAAGPFRDPAPGSRSR